MISTTPSHFLVGWRSEIGPRRSTNQDSGFAGDQLVLIADGVGGSPAGDLASATLVRELGPQWFRLDETDVPTLHEQVALANAALCELGRRDEQVHGMASTLTGLLANRIGAGFVVHVGDSRCYRVHAGEVQQITTDQSWVQMLMDEHMLSPERAARHPMRNLLMHSLSGSLSDSDAVQVTPVELVPRDRWLVATDGLTDYLTPEVLVDLLTRDADPQITADAMVDQCWALSRDNISLVVADVLAGSPSGTGRYFGAAASPAPRQQTDGRDAS